jgi:hypothetical protein
MLPGGSAYGPAQMTNLNALMSIRQRLGLA